jgi:hypothetical protein
LEEHLRSEQIEAAVALYQGEFLHGFHVRGARPFDGWAAQERERLHLAVADALHSQVDRDLAGGAFRAGIEHAQRLLALDPLLEAAHRQMMLLLAASGQRSAALSQYETCRDLLALTGHGEAPPIAGLFAGIDAVAFSPDGTLLASAGADAMARVWDVETGEEVLALQVHPDGLGATRLTFSPDGTRLATSSDQRDDIGDPLVRV